MQKRMQNKARAGGTVMLPAACAFKRSFGRKENGMLKYILMCMDTIMEALKQTAADIQELGAIFLCFCASVISASLKAAVWIGLGATAPLWISPYYIYKKTRKERRNELQTVEKEL